MQNMILYCSSDMLFDILYEIHVSIGYDVREPHDKRTELSTWKHYSE